MSANLDEFLDELQEKIYAKTKEDYGPYVLERWKNPQYIGVMDNPSASAKLKGSCGDSMEIFLRIENNLVKEASFLTDGCGPSVVSGDVACELAIGKSLEEAASISGEEILNKVGGLPEEKEHCAHLAAITLQEAIHNFMLKNRT
ncbi:iron-sulfur cluster assembly scaffold protein [Desulfovulcanus sp.]